jgi:hypothetical protein
MGIARNPITALATRAGRRQICVLLGLFAVMLASAFACTPGIARADIGEKIIDRCTHGESLRGFSPAAYQQALKDISAGTEEYSNCAQLIRQAELEAARAGRGGGGSSGTSAPSTSAPTAVAATPQERQAIARAPSAGAAPVQVGGQTVHPGVVHADIASALSSLPTPLLATLAFLLVGLLVVMGTGIRNRIRAHRGRGQ